MDPPTLHGVLETAIYCDDLPRTARFYGEVLGASVLFQDERLVALDAGAQSVVLLFRRGASANGIRFAGGSIPPHDGAGPAHLAFAIAATELAAWEARLAASGVAIESRVAWSGGGRSIYLRDPEGHSVELATPGVWPTY